MSKPNPIQFISKIEKFENVTGFTYLNIRGLDLSRFKNKPYDPTIVRRVKVIRKEQEKFKKFLILDIEDSEFKIQVSNQIFRQID